ncbi:MAG: hypothetical protein IPH88_16225, partial [Bacteroidales bacterium]|nr:hypothetical protein [Bacteroidales bacterium]
MYRGSYALFTHPIKLNEELSSLGYQLGKIPVEPPISNTDSIIQDLSIDLQTNMLHANSRRVFTGLNATTFQSFWHLINNERKDEIISTVFNMGKQNTEIESYDVQNSNPEDIGVKPMAWDLKLTASALVETAGNDILVRIGETIGEQSELYQETERKLPINVGTLRNYYRRLTFNIPDGYKVTNAADLNM